MAVLNVTFCAALPAAEGSWPVPRPIYTTAHNITISGASLQGDTGPNNSKLLRLHAEAACRFEVGESPTADASSTAMAAGQTEYVLCGTNHRVAVIQFTP